MNLEKIRTGAQTGIQLRRLPVGPQVRLGPNDTGLMAEPSRKHTDTAIPTGLSGPAIDVLGLLTATEKQVHQGRLHMRLIQWNLKTTGGYQKHWKR